VIRKAQLPDNTGLLLLQVVLAAARRIPSCNEGDICTEIDTGKATQEYSRNSHQKSAVMRVKEIFPKPITTTKIY
jgi:hypothetical protein